MHKKSVVAVLLLVLLAAVLLLGLPFTARRIIQNQMELPVFVTAPPPLNDEDTAEQPTFTD